MYRLISTGDVDAFVELLAPDFVEHEDLPARTSSTAGRGSWHACD
jgi:ketosteroid isomerase-like protein